MIKNIISKIESSITSSNNFVTKSETGAFYPTSNPSGYISSLDGINLSSYVATSQTGAFYAASNPSGYIRNTQTGAFYAASNPSGFITGVNLSSYVTNAQTGNFVITSQTGSFYAASNPSGYIRNTQTGAFYPASNPSGYISSLDGINLSSYVATSQTGAFYAASNPSGFVTSESLNLSNVVYTTGNQTIAGTKTFSNPTIFETESSQPTIRITQKTNGTGPVLVVEDKDNPDVSAFTITSSGHVLIGATGTVNNTPLQISSDNSVEGNLGSIITLNRSADVGAPIIRFMRATGSLSEPRPVREDSALGRLQFYAYTTGYGFSGFSISNEIASVTYSNNHQTTNGSGIIPGKLSIFTAGTDEFTRTEKFCLTPNGELFVGKGLFPTGEYNRGASVYSIPNDNVNIPLGLSTMAYVRNGFTGQLNKGEAVYISGAQGDKTLVLKASNTGEFTSSQTFGLAAENIAQNSDGYIITNGSLHGLNLQAFNDGDSLWLGSSNGSLTNVKPQFPNHSVVIGVVEKAGNGSNGIIYVKVQNGLKLDELHDVAVTNSLSGQFLYKNNNLWSGKFLSISDISGLQATLNGKQESGNYYLSSNPSGFITGVNLSSYVTNAQTGAFYAASNPSGYIRNTQTGAFYAASNPSGFITGVNLSSYVTNAQTGAFYAASNPSGYITSATSYSKSEINALLSGKSNTGHFHSASDITGGTLNNARTSATASNVTGTIVLRDSNGNFISNNITSSLTVPKSSSIVFNDTFGADYIISGGIDDKLFITQGGSTILEIDSTNGYQIWKFKDNIGSNNKIGIFTDTPATELHVNGTITANKIAAAVATTVESGLMSTGDKILLNSAVFTTGNQTISGVKSFASKPIVNGTPVLISGEAGGITRGTASITTTSIAASGTFTTTVDFGCKSYGLLSVSGASGAWVKLYYDTASRTSDASRTIDQDPASNVSLMAECLSTGSNVIRFAPSTIGYNDGTSNLIPIAITNTKNVASTYSVSFNFLKLEI